MRAPSTCIITFALCSSLILGLILALAASNAEPPASANQQVIATVDLKAILMDSLPGKAVQVVAETKLDRRTTAGKLLLSIRHPQDPPDQGPLWYKKALD